MTKCLGLPLRVQSARSIVLLMLLLGLTVGVFGGAGSEDLSIPPEAREWTAKAIEQLGVGVREAVFAWPASEPGELKLRVGRILNVLVGRESPLYQPQAGDPPGSDGTGVLIYVGQLQRVLDARSKASDRVRSLLFSLMMVRFFAEEAREELSEAVRARDLRVVRQRIRRSLAFLTAARGNREDPLSEGGLRAMLAAMGAQ